MLPVNLSDTNHYRDMACVCLVSGSIYCVSFLVLYWTAPSGYRHHCTLPRQLGVLTRCAVNAVFSGKTVHKWLPMRRSYIAWCQTRADIDTNNTIALPEYVWRGVSLTVSTWYYVGLRNRWFLYISVVYTKTGRTPGKAATLALYFALLR